MKHLQTYKLRYALIIILLVHTLFSSANITRYFPDTLSNNATISFIACEPGEKVYSIFGHAAIRVQDQQNNLDACFHWGIFDYGSEDFIYRFVKGETDYEMGIYPTPFFMKEYIERQSTVYEAVLNLPQKEKQNLYKKLLFNYEPQNRKYRYNYVFDNCSTRPINLILGSTGNISLNEDIVKTSTTFRDIIAQYNREGSILSFGIDLVVASPADRYITNLQASAFPLYALDYLKNTTIDNRPIIKKVITLYTGADRTHKSKAPIRHLLNVLFIFLAFSFVAFYIRTKRIPKLAISILLSISTLTGLIICFLMFISVHPLVGYNINALWLNPLHPILITAMYIKQSKTTFVISSCFNIATLMSGLFYAFQIQAPCSPVITLWVLYLTAQTLITLDSHNKISFK